MKKFIIVILVMALIIGLVPVSIAMAAKPVQNNGSGDLIPIGNGFPSGMHYNLNIHGKKDGFTCPDPSSDNNSVFIPLYGSANISYVQNINKKGRNSSDTYIDNLIVLDNCAFDDGQVLVQIPYETEGYYVYGRILAKPNNGKNNDGTSEIILWPNQIVEACDNVTAESENATSCDEVLAPLGMVIGDNVYVAENQTFKRFEQGTEKVKGRGKSTAVDITALFTYSGYVADNITDLNGDKVLDVTDVPGGTENATYIVEWFTNNITALGDAFPVPDSGNPLYYDSTETKVICNETTIAVGDGSGYIDTIGEWLMFLADLYTWTQETAPANLWILDAPDNPLPWSYVPRVEFYCNEFILNVADLVVSEQEVNNNGTRLLQVRFYPVATTSFDKIK